jgi:hypothetical protein
LLGPVFGTVLMHLSGGGTRELGHYQTTFTPLLYGVALAIVLTLLLRETGPGTRRHAKASREAHDMHVLTTSSSSTGQ